MAVIRKCNLQNLLSNSYEDNHENDTHNDRFGLNFMSCLYYDMNRTTTHPGDILKEELETRGISQKKFSEVLRIPYTQLNEILNGKRPVTTDFALMMEAALGINPELLINMQTRYNMSVARQKKSLLERLIDIKKVCAVVF